jgi:hypothetical protein
MAILFHCHVCNVSLGVDDATPTEFARAAEDHTHRHDDCQALVKAGWSNLSIITEHYGDEAEPMPVKWFVLLSQMEQFWRETEVPLNVPREHVVRGDHEAARAAFAAVVARTGGKALHASIRRLLVPLPVSPPKVRAASVRPARDDRDWTLRLADRLEGELLPVAASVGPPARKRKGPPARGSQR